MRRRRLMPAARVRTALVALCAVLITALGGACHHRRRAAPTAAALPIVHENYCWWAVFRTALPPDTVVARFADAFAVLGLGGVTRAAQADTAWVYARPSLLDSSSLMALGAMPPSWVYAARVVAFRRGDSTLYRHFVAVGPPWGEALADSGALARRHIGLCAALGRAAAIGGTAPREPDGEEKRPVWTRYGRRAR